MLFTFLGVGLTAEGRCCAVATPSEAAEVEVVPAMMTGETGLWNPPMLGCMPRFDDWDLLLGVCAARATAACIWSTVGWGRRL